MWREKMIKPAIITTCAVLALNIFTFKEVAPQTTERMAEQAEMTAEEFILISSITEAESNRSQDPEDLDGRILIAVTILNRVNDTSGAFPNTIEGVLNQPGQFATMRNGIPVCQNTELSDQAVLQAAELIEAGEAPAVYFFNCIGYNSLGEPYGDGPVGGNYFMTWEAGT
jgi:spore germination cell wall hydrolase CwlJ-like protein